MFRSDRIPADFGERAFATLVPFYQCDINCLLEFTGGIDVDRLTRAFLAALAEEPMWSHRFVPAFWRPYWQPIPRSARRALVRVVTTDDSPAALDRILREPVRAAASLIVLRGHADDTLCFRIDHRLADPTAARCLIAAVATHYAAGDPAPAADAPVVRRTIKLLYPILSPQQRKQNLAYIRRQARSTREAPAAFRLPPVTREDPAALPPLLHYPVGALDELTIRAMRDRVTPTLAILAATYLAVRDVAGIISHAPLSLILMVDLRRYLPAAARHTPASMFIGQARLRVEESGPMSMTAVIDQLRARITEERGPQFGLRWSPLSADIPRARLWTHGLPFALMRFGLRVRYRNFKATPAVGVSDVGAFGRPGDRWGDAVLQNGYAMPGVWGVPSISVCSSTCGSRFTIAIGTRPRSFADDLAAAVRARLCDYVGWPCAPTVATSEGPASV